VRNWETLHSIVLDAFSESELEELLAYDIDIVYANIKEGDNFHHSVRKLIEHLERHGKISEFVNAIRTSRKNNQDIMSRIDDMLDVEEGLRKNQGRSNTGTGDFVSEFKRIDDLFSEKRDYLAFKAVMIYGVDFDLPSDLRKRATQVKREFSAHFENRPISEINVRAEDYKNCPQELFDRGWDLLFEMYQKLRSLELVR